MRSRRSKLTVFVFCGKPTNHPSTRTDCAYVVLQEERLVTVPAFVHHLTIRHAA